MNEIKVGQVYRMQSATGKMLDVIVHTVHHKGWFELLDLKTGEFTAWGRGSEGFHRHATLLEEATYPKAGQVWARRSDNEPVLLLGANRVKHLRTGLVARIKGFTQSATKTRIAQRGASA